MKADLASITSRPTAKEKKHLEKILHNTMGMPEPNVCMTYYKNRGGKYNDVKIWLYVDYSTMRVHDLFCTDKENNLIEITPTYTKIVEDKLVVFTEKERITLTEDEIIAPYEKVEIEDSVADFFNDESKSEKIKKELNKISSKAKTGSFKPVEDDATTSTTSDNDANITDVTEDNIDEVVEEKSEKEILTSIMNDDDIDW